MEQYLEKGPGFIFLYHPALGPLWDVIAQKVRGGALAHGSELVLEVRCCTAPEQACGVHLLSLLAPLDMVGVGLELFTYSLKQVEVLVCLALF